MHIGYDPDERTTAGEKDKEKDGDENAATEEKPLPSPELPAEVQTRLRKLDKLEPKYSGRFACKSVTILVLN